MKFGDDEVRPDQALADFKATEALHAEACKPSPLGVQYPTSKPCPCRSAVALLCPHCGVPVWVAVDPKRTEPCEHAISLYEALS